LLYKSKNPRLKDEKDFRNSYEYMNVEQKEWLQESLKLIYIEHHASSVFELIYSPDRLCSSLASVLYEGMEVGKGGLIESWAWRHDKDTVLNFSEAKKVLSEYTK
jgi:hypothetical protein